MLTVSTVQVTTDPVPNPSVASPDVATEVYQQQYRETYTDLAIEVQQTLDFPVIRSYQELFQLGCTDPMRSQQIDQAVAQHQMLRDWPMADEDCIGIISQGPYVQSQINFHGVPIRDVMDYVCDLFREMPDASAVVEDIAA